MKAIADELNDPTYDNLQDSQKNRRVNKPWQTKKNDK